MKLFAYIFSFYILLLTAIPCVDHPEDQSVKKSEIAQSSAENHQNHSDQCSPFCTCDCCVSPVIHQDSIARIDNFSILPGSFSPEYSSVVFSCPLSSIWQPPQIA
jgi:hypothetical protein